MQCCCNRCFFFFFKQKTAYEMRISDWSSDVCSSDLLRRFLIYNLHNHTLNLLSNSSHIPNKFTLNPNQPNMLNLNQSNNKLTQIGRASCRERVCQYV